MVKSPCFTTVWEKIVSFTFPIIMAKQSKFMVPKVSTFQNWSPPPVFFLNVFEKNLFQKHGVLQES